MTYRADGDLFVLRRTAASAPAAADAHADASAAPAAHADAPAAAAGGGGPALLLLFNFGARPAAHVVEGGRWRAAEVARELLPAGCRPCGADGWVGAGAAVEVPPGSAVVLEALP
jgi:hypothetical protein